MAVKRGHYHNGQLKYEHTHQENKEHGIMRGWQIDGKPTYTLYYLYGKRTTKEEFDKYRDILRQVSRHHFAWISSNPLKHPEFPNSCFQSATVKYHLSDRLSWNYCQIPTVQKSLRVRFAVLRASGQILCIG